MTGQVLSYVAARIISNPVVKICVKALQTEDYMLIVVWEGDNGADELCIDKCAALSLCLRVGKFTRSEKTGPGEFERCVDVHVFD